MNAKGRRNPKVAQHIDLYWDDKPLESSSSHAANVALPHLR
jgi:hypothetical protein